ncbi:MAG: transcription termination/antitermination protein NusA [Succinivibrionaceae bacterium]|nr:transcription termination/antitermination protein NusA [Succinivibrionaceae bacterium]
MDSKQIKDVVESVSNEKGLSEQKVFEVLEYAIAVAVKNCLDKSDINVRVSINPKTCEYQVFRSWEVVADDELTKPMTQITLSAARIDDPSINIGDSVEDEIDVEEAKSRRSGFDRIAAQTAKNVIVQKIRDAERERVVESYKNMVGKIVTGTVKKRNRDSIVLDLGSRQSGNNAEAVMTRENWLKNDVFSMNQRVRAALLPMNESKTSQLSVSRTCNDFLLELVRFEVPEVNDGVIGVKALVREPGVRAKIAVYSRDKRIDPLGSCLGMHSSRVRAVMDELGGDEKVDFVLWDPDPAEFVVHSMAPAKPEKVYINEEAHSIDLAFLAENKSQAIGKNGVNVRLASRLTGWVINVYDVDEYETRMAEKSDEIIRMFQDELNIDEEFATVLVEEGYESLDAIAYQSRSELTQIDGLDDELAEALQDAAKAAIEKNASKAKDLMTLDGVDESLAAAFAGREIYTKEELAEMAVDDLMDIDGMTQEKASKLIVAAREACHWFD